MKTTITEHDINQAIKLREACVAADNAFEEFLDGFDEDSIQKLMEAATPPMPFDPIEFATKYPNLKPVEVSSDDKLMGVRAIYHYQEWIITVEFDEFTVRTNIDITDLDCCIGGLDNIDDFLHGVDNPIRPPGYNVYLGNFSQKA